MLNILILHVYGVLVIPWIKIRRFSNAARGRILKIKCGRWSTEILKRSKSRWLILGRFFWICRGFEVSARKRYRFGDIKIGHRFDQNVEIVSLGNGSRQVVVDFNKTNVLVKEDETHFGTSFDFDADEKCDEWETFNTDRHFRKTMHLVYRP